jgi:hypothetical protein
VTTEIKHLRIDEDMTWRPSARPTEKRYVTIRILDEDGDCQNSIDIIENHDGSVSVEVLENIANVKIIHLVRDSLDSRRIQHRTPETSGDHVLRIEPLKEGR